jgi:S-adenosylmethionine:tRNA-ribosyltransferase-isomerase (queuine synthetase)
LRHEDIVANRLHSERVEVDAACCDAIHQTREVGGRVIAVGTTSVRALESAIFTADARCSIRRYRENNGRIRPCCAEQIPLL